MVRYVFNNPVRAGLAPSPLEYPFSGSLMYSRARILDALSDRPGEQLGAG
jgi:hypothetical protein